MNRSYRQGVIVCVECGYNEKVMVIAKIKAGDKVLVYTVSLKRKMWDKKYDGKSGGKKFLKNQLVLVI